MSGILDTNNGHAGRLFGNKVISLEGSGRNWLLPRVTLEAIRIAYRSGRGFDSGESVFGVINFSIYNYRGGSLSLRYPVSIER